MRPGDARIQSWHDDGGHDEYLSIIRPPPLPARGRSDALSGQPNRTLMNRQADLLECPPDACLRHFLVAVGLLRRWSDYVADDDERPGSSRRFGRRRGRPGSTAWRAAAFGREGRSSRWRAPGRRGEAASLVSCRNGESAAGPCRLLACRRGRRFGRVHRVGGVVVHAVCCDELDAAETPRVRLRGSGTRRRS